MSATDLIRDALFGNPPSPTHEPSREGVYAAFAELNRSVAFAIQGMESYETVADLPDPAPEDGTQARVYDDADPDNDGVWIVIDGEWVKDTNFYNQLADVVQPLVDEAAEQADRSEENAEIASLAADSALASANSAAESASFAEEFSGPVYDSISDGVIATTVGHFFRVANGTTPETYTRYERTDTSPFYVEAAGLATTAQLASTDPGEGASLVGMEGGGTVQDAIADLIATKADRPFGDLDALEAGSPNTEGEGSLFQAGSGLFQQMDDDAPPFDPSTDVDGYTAETANLLKLQIRGNATGDHFGLSRSKMDNGPQLQDAFEWLFAQGGRSFDLSDRFILDVGQSIHVEIDKFIGPTVFRGNGARFRFAANEGIHIEGKAGGTSRGLTLENLKILNGGTPLKISSEDLNSGFIYNLLITGMQATGFTGNGIHLEGNVFEAALFHNLLDCEGNNTGYPIYLTNGSGSGLISSIDIYGGTTRGGRIGLYAINPVQDLRIYGGTYILAQREGIRIENSIGSAIYGTHLEGNWEGAPNLAAGGAGLSIAGTGTISGVVGYTNVSQKQKYVVEAYATGPLVVTGGARFGGTKYGYYGSAGVTTGDLILIGTQAQEYDVFTPFAPTNIGRNMLVRQFADTLNTSATVASGTYTFNLNAGSHLAPSAAITGNITIANPTNRSTTGTASITVSVAQNATGGHTVSWGSDFATPTAADGTASTVSVWVFRWIQNKWREVSFSSSAV